MDLEKVSMEDLGTLLEDHPGLSKSNPFRNSNKDDDDYIGPGNMLLRVLDLYLKEVGLEGYVQRDLTGKCYVINHKGVEALEEYKMERESKITIPRISIIIASIALLLSLASIVVAIIAMARGGA